ncbi:MAG: AraC family transcriptional regulator [Alphaproteobacteria bacterium]|nr:AraC family transcriptional regulator [Alphaproteobacteria bacterium]
MAFAVRIVQGKLGRVALFELDNSLGVHAHSQWHILIKCDGADSAYSIRNRTWPLSEKRAVLVNSWEPHKYIHPIGAPPSTILALYIEPQWLSRLDHNVEGLARAGMFACPGVEITPVIRQAVNSLVDGLTWSEEVEEAVLEHLTLDLVEAVLRNWVDARPDDISLPKQFASDFRIRKAISYIAEHTNETLNVNSLARHSGISRPHLFTLFRRYTNLSPGLYANMLRMNSAVSRISAGSDTMCVIAGDLGFSAQSHFTRFFQKQWGIPPSEYRRVVQCMDTDRP